MRRRRRHFGSRLGPKLPANRDTTERFVERHHTCVCEAWEMQLGAVFPTNEIGNDLGAIREWVQTAEALGYDSIIVYDHVVGAVHADRNPPLWGPYNEADPFHEPFVLLGWMAAITHRIELMTGVIIAPQRQTVLLAKQAAQVDVMSGGRFTLGLGTGWNPVEYEALGESFEHRGERLDEQIDLLRQLFREPLLDYTGTQHRVDRAGLLPRPTRDIPIWCGGGSAPALRRAAKLADGFIFGGAGPRIHALADQLNTMVRTNGRDPATFAMTEIIDHAAGPDEWRTERDIWEAKGGTQIAVQTMDIIYRWRGGVPNGFTTPAEHINALVRFAREMEV